MDFKALLRTSVVKTNVIPPLRQLNRVPYRIALTRVCRLCRSFPEIKSLYLRHGLTRDDWVPGLSDIDLTLITSSELSARTEYDFLLAFRQAYTSLKRRYPMLGEVDCLTETHCSSWTRFTMRGYEVRDWRLIYGLETVESLYVQGEASLRQDAFDLALTVFEEFILDRFYGNSAWNWVDIKSLVRIAAKVRRYASVGRAGMSPKYFETDQGVSEILLQLLISLDEAARQLIQESGFPVPTCGAGDRLADPQLAVSPSSLTEIQTEQEFAASRFLGLKDCRDSIASLTLGYGCSHLILRDGLVGPGAVEALENIRSVCRAGGMQPLILTPVLSEYFLTRYRPRQGLELQENRHVLFGQDPTLHIGVPTAQSCAREVLHQSLNALLAPANCVLYPDGKTNSRFLAKTIWRSMLIKLYLDTGLVGSFAACNKRCRGLYPGLCSEIDQLNESQLIPEGTLRWGHRLLRALSWEIDEKMGMLSGEQLYSARLVHD